MKFSTGKLFSLLGILFIITIVTLFTQSFSSAENNENEKVLKNQVVTQPTFPEQITFCEQSVPLQYFDVAESLDRELFVNVYWQSNTSFLLKRSQRYFPIIDSILKANEIPADFRYLAVIESGLQNVTSPSNAKGFWQFLEETGKEYGLEINNNVDERLNLEKSTVAACKYLRKAYEKFNDWFLVAASYNMGMGGLSRSLESQKVTTYFDLKLNTETGRYVYRILAAKLILENPELYNYKIADKYLYQPLKYREIKIDTSINDITAFALSNNTNVKLFKMLNPWILDDKLDNSKRKEYTLKIPTSDLREQTFTKSK